MKYRQAPLYDLLQSYRKANLVSFHVPGHKKGKVYDDTHKKNVFTDIMSIDVTEMSETDNLHFCEGVIKQSQQLAALCFGSNYSYFLVGGSTVGNLALLLTVCAQPNSLILLQRNVHKSVLHGLMLAGARAVFMDPYIDPYSQLAVIPSLDTICKAIEQYPDAKALFLTSPNYYGLGGDLAAIHRVCHNAKIPLLVDEAHGAHYGHHPSFPPSALSCGADAVVQSTHKMLSALTMGGMLHIQGSLLNRQLLEQRLTMVQSSSPSYPIMASLDAARAHIHANGPHAFTTGLGAVRAFCNGLKKNPRFQVLSLCHRKKKSEKINKHVTQDPFKIVIYDGEGILTGYQLHREIEKYGCIPEMSDEKYVVLVFSLGSTMQDTENLLYTLHCISKQKKGDENLKQTTKSKLIGKKHIIEHPYLYKSVSEPVSFRLAPVLEQHIEKIDVEQSVDRIMAEMVTPYPPGIPVLYIGEAITPSAVRYLVHLRDHKVNCKDVADRSLRTIRVMKQKNITAMNHQKTGECTNE